MAMTDRAALFIDDLDLHRSIKVLAAEEGISMKALTERLIRLGMVAPELARLIDDAGFSWDREQALSCPWCNGLWSSATGQICHDEDCPAAVALARAEAALNGKETE